MRAGIICVSGIAVLLCACSRKPNEVSSTAPSSLRSVDVVSTAAAAKGHRIGSPCTLADGYAGIPEPVKPADAGELWAAGPPFGPDFFQLAPGVGYCIPAGSGKSYARGYYTMNCATDGDCPAGAQCDGRLCRAPCQSDNDCSAPETCSPNESTATEATPVRFCSMLSANSATVATAVAAGAQGPPLQASGPIGGVAAVVGGARVK